MQVDEIKKVLILGAGTMGHQIGFLCATHGMDVALFDISPEVLESAKKRTAKLAERFVRHGKATGEETGAALARMIWTTAAEEAAAEADIVSESVPEDPELKGRVFSEFNALCPERTVFTSNTSTLVPSMFAEAAGRPERLCALHFHDVALTNVVDVMPHPGTSEETLELVTAFAERIGQVCIVLKKESFGYVFNAMLSEWFRSAQNLAANGVASPEDVDRAWMGVMRVSVGPFGVMDTVGLDTVWKITDYWAEKNKDPQARRNAAYMKRYVDAGRLGVKSGRGIYSYPNPEWSRPDFLGKHGR